MNTRISVYVALKSKKLNEDFCSSIEKSHSAKVTDKFFTLKDCRKKLSVSVPHVPLLGLDLPDGYWIDFCQEIREKYPSLKIIAITTYNEYIIFKNALENYTTGYISTDAMPKVIVSAIEAVIQGDFFRYEQHGEPEELEEPDPEWLQTLIRQMSSKIKSDDNPLEMMEKMSMITNAIEKERRMMMKNLLSAGKDNLDHRLIDKHLMQLIEFLLVQGCSNWKIAEMLNVSIETVRVYRMEFIVKISRKYSMLMTQKKNGETVSLARRELQIIRLIAAGYTSLEISKKILYISVETVRSIRSDLFEKFEVNNATSLVISAMRLGLIKIEEIDALLSS